MSKKLARNEFDSNYCFQDKITSILGLKVPKEAFMEKNIFDNITVFHPVELGTLDELLHYLYSNIEDVKNESLLQ